MTVENIHDQSPRKSFADLDGEVVMKGSAMKRCSHKPHFAFSGSIMRQLRLGRDAQDDLNLRMSHTLEDTFPLMR